MPASRQSDQEVGIREAVDCIITPSTYTVFQDDDARFYPARLVQVGESSSLELLFLDEVFVNFEHYDDALSFCQEMPSVHHHLLLIPVPIRFHYDTY